MKIINLKSIAIQLSAFIIIVSTSACTTPCHEHVESGGAGCVDNPMYFSCGGSFKAGHCTDDHPHR